MSIFNDNDLVLLVGEGNFSFSAALSEQNLNVELVASCYESGVCQEAAEKNVNRLRKNGTCVLFNVDATKLEECPSLKLRLFDKIIFNFPHVGGKMRIERNRELLKGFFMSSARMIKENGQILVTLCNGQGGTPVDKPQRRWDDSWKIVEMAAHGNFILTRVDPFLWQSFEDYIVTGYRGLNKQFHTSGSLTHFFTKSQSPTAHNIAPKNKINAFTLNNITWKGMINSLQNKLDYELKCIYPCTFTFDLTVSTDEYFNTAEFYQLLYNYAGSIIENVDLIDCYSSPDDKKIKRTYRIDYKSNYIPLYRKRVIELHQNVIANFVEDNFKVVVSR
ncbi:hypothetical protein PUN28_004325 [Cardiocondyla obscurior]